MNKSQRAYLLALFVAIAVFQRDIWLFRIYGLGFGEDSNTYTHFIEKAYKDLVTPLYPLTNFLLSSHLNPFAIVFFQFILAALAAFTLVAVLAKQNFWFGLLVGVFFILDFVWGASDHWILTEPFLISFSLISLACFLQQWQHRRSLTSRSILAAGLLYGWTLTIRPSSFFFVVIVIGAYFLTLPNKLKTFWLAVGSAAIVIAIGLFNLLYIGEFKIFSGGGIYLAYPLFVNELFAPENGPASQKLDQHVRACIPDLVDYHVTEDYYAFIINRLGPFFRCQLPVSGYQNESSLLTSAYIESFFHRPDYYVRQIARPYHVYFAYPVAKMAEGYPIPLGKYMACHGFDWCDPVKQQVDQLPKEPIDAQREQMKQITNVSASITQIYLLPLSWFGYTVYDTMANSMHPTLPNLKQDQASQISTISFWVLAALLALFTRGRMRVLALACVIYIQFTGTIVVVAQVFLPRYTIYISPFYSLLSAVTIASVVQWIVWGIRRIRQGRRAGVARVERNQRSGVKKHKRPPVTKEAFDVSYRHSTSDSGSDQHRHQRRSRPAPGCHH